MQQYIGKYGICEEQNTWACVYPEACQTLNSGFNRRRKLKVSFAHPCLFISFYHLLSLKTAKEATIFILPAKCTIYIFEWV